MLVISKLKLCIDRRIKKTDIVAMGFWERYIFWFLVYVQKVLLEVIKIVIMFFNFLIIIFQAVVIKRKYISKSPKIK